MEFNFDKEIDAFLRNEARNVKSVSNENTAHLDADEISAFAENVLPNKVRIRATEHLANCGNCRISLSNIIVLNSEIPDEMPAQVVQKEIVVTPVPWYRKIFAVPNLAYSMGALLLVFSGLIAFVVVQNFTSGNELSQINEQQFNTNSITTANISSAESDAIDNANAANMSFNSNMTVASEDSVSESDANLSKQTENRSEAAKKDSPAEESDNSPENNKTSTPAPPAPQAGNFADSAVTVTKSAPRQTPAPLNAASSGDNETTSSGETEQMKENKEPNPVMRSKNDSSSRAKEKKANVEKTSVGGKNFKRENNVWIDIDYQNQETIKITRGTDEYKKLDKDLRVIVENLGGTVIIVWKEKAYRIR